MGWEMHFLQGLQSSKEKHRGVYTRDMKLSEAWKTFSKEV